MSRSARTAAPFLAALITVAGLGAADGGYFPSDWGLATLGFTLVAVTLVLVTDASRPGGLELAFLAGLAVFAGWAALSSFWSPGAAAPVLEAERGLLDVRVCRFRGHALHDVPPTAITASCSRSFSLITTRSTAQTGYGWS